MEKMLRGERRNKKEAAPMADTWIEDAIVFEADEEVLSSWEMVTASDDEIEDYSYDDFDLYVFESLSPDLSSHSPPHDLTDQANNHDDDHVHRDLTKPVSIDEMYGYNHYGDYNDDEDQEVEEEEEEEDDDDDLDDELVPRSVSDRFGRERMRKLGKRAYQKMNKSKRLPYHYNRPGCVHGKHGLGLRHTIVF